MKINSATWRPHGEVAATPVPATGRFPNFLAAQLIAIQSGLISNFSYRRLQSSSRYV